MDLGETQNECRKPKRYDPLRNSRINWKIKVEFSILCSFSLKIHNERSFIRSFENPEKNIQVHLIQQGFFLK